MPRGGGYRRFWLAEHHNMVGIASAATAVVISYVAAGTRTIRVGAGGIMLPNHSPLVTDAALNAMAQEYSKMRGSGNMQHWDMGVREPRCGSVQEH